jgi:acyl-CoA reductase-like NAD-dependent aldehyde dehydrogenase/nicotinamidase-related amidase
VSRTALLLVDLQEDYLARRGLTPPREELIANIVVALAEARQTGEPIFHIRTDGSDPMPHRAGVPEVVAGTPGAEPPPELRELPGEPVLTKRFFSAFDAPGLADALAAAGVTRLRLVGVHAHACIQATALDAYANGFEVEVDQRLVGSDLPSLASQSLRWLDGRAASLVSNDDSGTWLHRDPCDQDRILDEINLTGAAEVAAAAERLALPSLPIEERAQRLRHWSAALHASSGQWVDAIVETVAKPRRDAEAEVAYGLALLDHVAATLADQENQPFPSVKYRPTGLVGLITPWNNPFAIPLGKLAPALGYGNAVLWKPALPGSRVAALLRDSLDAAGLSENLALVTGGAGTGRAFLETAALSALSFTGSVPVGRAIIAAAGHRALPVQAELGGSNAAIVDESADLEAAAADLAAAMFSFAGQRCTAIRRIIVLQSIADSFTERLVSAVAALSLGLPANPETQVGPVIDRVAQRRFLALTNDADILIGGSVPTSLPATGCWIEPTLLADLPPDHPLLIDEVFGPIAAIQVASGLDEAITLHNSTKFGLLGGLFTEDANSERAFLREAAAGMLSINRARPPFPASGPFVGWKASGFGPAEHGRWNREVYTRPQACFRAD